MNFSMLWLNSLFCDIPTSCFVIMPTSFFFKNVIVIAISHSFQIYNKLFDTGVYYKVISVFFTIQNYLLGYFLGSLQVYATLLLWPSLPYITTSLIYLFYDWKFMTKHLHSMANLPSSLLYAHDLSVRYFCLVGLFSILPVISKIMLYLSFLTFSVEHKYKLLCEKFIKKKFIIMPQMARIFFNDDYYLNIDMLYFIYPLIYWWTGYFYILNYKKDHNEQRSAFLHLNLCFCFL